MSRHRGDGWLSRDKQARGGWVCVCGDVVSRTRGDGGLSRERQARGGGVCVCVCVCVWVGRGATPQLYLPSYRPFSLSLPPSLSLSLSPSISPDRTRTH